MARRCSGGNGSRWSYENAVKEFASNHPCFTLILPLLVHVWIFENGVEELNSRLKRTFFLAKGDNIKLKGKSVVFFLHPFIVLSLPSFLYFLPFQWLGGGLKV